MQRCIRAFGQIFDWVSMKGKERKGNIMNIMVLFAGIVLLVIIAVVVIVAAVSGATAAVVAEEENGEDE